jgi:hypothetical protein
LVEFNPPIYSSDAVLVYHLYDTVNGQDIWKLMPQTYYFFSDGGELDFNFIQDLMLISFYQLILV